MQNQQLFFVVDDMSADHTRKNTEIIILFFSGVGSEGGKLLKFSSLGYIPFGQGTEWGIFFWVAKISNVFCG